MKMKDKSMINMAGTSMGSYNKPMMKGGERVYISKSMPKFDSKDSTKTDSTNIKGERQMPKPFPLPRKGERQMPKPFPLPRKGERQMPKPFLNQKTSGLEMKCGCQVGKHMGGPKMMGGDEKKGFRESFAENRKAGKKEFEYEGKMYSTKTAEDVAKGLNDKDLYKAFEKAEAIVNSFENVPGSSKLKSNEEQFNSYLNEGLKRENAKNAKIEKAFLGGLKLGVVGGAKMMGKKSYGK